jgi:hypothetical protein
MRETDTRSLLCYTVGARAMRIGLPSSQAMESAKRCQNLEPSPAIRLIVTARTT